MSVNDFCRFLAQRANVSIVVQEALDHRMVSVDFKDVPIEDALQAVARRSGVQLIKSGSVYLLGELRPEDRAVLVRRVARLSAEDLSGAIQVLMSEYGRYRAMTDGLVIVGDRVEVIQRVIAMLDQIESAGAESWVIQLYVVQAKKNNDSDFGVDVVPAADMALTFATASGAAAAVAKGFSFTGDASITSALHASLDRGHSRMLTAPMFVLADGETSHYESGTTIYVAKRNTSPEGTVTTLGYDAYPTGTQIDLGIRGVDAGTCRLKLSFSIGNYDGQRSDGGPIITRTAFQAGVNLASGGAYLLAVVDRDQNSLTQSGPLQLRNQITSEKQNLEIWCRAYRVAGPLTRPEAERAGEGSPRGEGPRPAPQ